MMRHDGTRYWYLRNKETNEVIEDLFGYTVYWPMTDFTEEDMIEEAEEYDIYLNESDCKWELAVHRDF